MKILIIANSATCQKVFVVPDSLWSVTQSSKFLNHGDSLVTLVTEFIKLVL